MYQGDPASIEMSPLFLQPSHMYSPSERKRFGGNILSTMKTNRACEARTVTRGSKLEELSTTYGLNGRAEVPRTFLRCHQRYNGMRVVPQKLELELEVRKFGLFRFGCWYPQNIMVVINFELEATSKSWRACHLVALKLPMAT